MKRSFVILIVSLSFLFTMVTRAQDRAPQADLKIDAAVRTQVIDAVIKNMKDYYVSPETADEIERVVREHQRKKEYDNITSAAEFAKLLTRQLREISRDKHVSLNYSEKPLPVSKGQAEPTAEERQGIRNYGEAINYGFERIERLTGNIGYIRLNLFFPVEYGGETAVAAMRLVAGTDALIIDLRGNDGGQPEMIELIASYFFSPQPAQLSGIYQRRTNTVQY